MTAQPIAEEDPRDPQVILRDLPKAKRAAFLREYQDAVDAAHEPAGYKRLQLVLQVWSLRVRVYRQQPNYDEEVAAEVEAVRSGAVATMDFVEAINAERARRVS
jgi:hypothetical protein